MVSLFKYLIKVISNRFHFKLCIIILLINVQCSLLNIFKIKREKNSTIMFFVSSQFYDIPHFHIKAKCIQHDTGVNIFLFFISNCFYAIYVIL